ncbi:MAG: MFS transporter [Nevskiales bacterium]
MKSQLPYARLSGFYFFYYAAVGAYLPYWSLYLDSLGYTPVDIGALMAVAAFTRIFAPLLWGWYADHAEVRMPIIRTASFLSLVFFVMIPFVHSFTSLLLIMLVYSFFWNATLPQFEAVTLNHLQDDEHRYGSIRLWGSVGFVIAVIAVGPLLDRTGLEPLPFMIAAMSLAMGLTSLWVPDSAYQPTSRPEDKGLWRVLRQPQVISLLLACFLSQISFGPFYAFFSIFLEEHGYSRSMIGMLWSLGVVAEIGVFMTMAQLFRLFGARPLMLVALALTAVRWAVLAWRVDSLAALLFVQLLHLVSFGVYHAVSLHLIHRLFRGRLQGRGQAIYSSVSFGAGGGIGVFLSGWMWEAWSGEWVYISAAVVAVLATLIAFLGIREPGGVKTAA